MAQVTLKGNPVNVDGQLPQKGAQAPAFSLVGGDLADVTLENFAGKRKVLNIFPSVDTPTCATSVRKFNVEAGKLANTVVLCSTLFCSSSTTTARAARPASGPLAMATP